MMMIKRVMIQLYSKVRSRFKSRNITILFVLLQQSWTMELKSVWYWFLQLDHRILATATLASIGGLWWSARKLDLHPAIRSLVGSTMGMAALQVTLGISTLLSYVPVSLGTAHQAGALTLLTLMLLLNHTLRRPSPMLLKSLPAVAKTI